MGLGIQKIRNAVSCWVLTGLLISALYISPVHAWLVPGSSITSVNTFGSCTLQSSQLTNGLAIIYLRKSPTNLAVAGGFFFSGGAAVAHPSGSFDKTEIETNCGISSVSIISQSGPNVGDSFATWDSDYGATIRGKLDSDGKNYEWKIYMSGAAGAVPTVLFSRNEYADASTANEIVTGFLQNRASNVIATLPDFGGFLGGEGVTGSTKGFYLNQTGGNGTFALAGTLTPNASSKKHAGKTMVWYQLRGVHSQATTTSSDLGIGYIGGHRFISRNALVGAVLMADFASETESTSGSQGTGRGFMVGPYFAANLKGSKLRIEGQALWGRSLNSISPVGTYTDQYTTERFLVRGKVEGSFQRGQWTVSPAASLSYYNETQAAYTDSLANAIPLQTVTLGEARIGPTFQRYYALNNGSSLGLKMGASAITNFSIASSSGSQGIPLGNGAVRARVDFGLSATTKKGWNLSGDWFYDGLGVANYNSYGMTLRAGVQF